MASSQKKRSKTVGIIAALWIIWGWIRRTDRIASWIEKIQRKEGAVRHIGEFLASDLLFGVVSIACLLAIAWLYLPDELQAKIRRSVPPKMILAIIIGGLLGSALGGGGYLVWKKWLVGQPELRLLPPTHKFTFRWVPEEDLQWVIRPELQPGEMEPLGTRLPVFLVKNHGSGQALDVTAQWIMRGIPVEKVFLRRPLPEKFSVTEPKQNLLGITVTHQSGSNMSATLCMDDETSQVADSIPSARSGGLNPTLVPIPVGTSGSFELRVVFGDRVPDSLTYGSFNGPVFEVLLKYHDEHGENYERKFEVTSTITSLGDDVGAAGELRPPKTKSSLNLRATIKFSVSEIKEQRKESEDEKE